MARSDDLDEGMHREFWTEVRSEQLCEAAKALVDSKTFSATQLAGQARRTINPEVTDLDRSHPSPVGITRFLKPVPGTFHYEQNIKSAICKALNDEVQRRATVDPTLKSQLEALFKDCYTATKMKFPSARNPKRRTIKTLELLRNLASIDDPLSDDNPLFPEFPSHSPRFPATPVIQFKLNDLKIVIKDESANPTGSHKDRWAREQILRYKKELLEVIGGRSEIYADEIPKLAMISGGSAALALQSALRLAGLSALRVVVDKDRTSQRVVARLEAMGAIVSMADLDTAELGSDDVRTLTKLGEIDRDVTPRKMDEAESEPFYDWLTCEILKERPRYVFLPVGTGMLYANLMLFLAREVESKNRDLRIAGLELNELKGIHLIGATSNESATIMKKLYASHRPSVDGLPEKITELITSGILGKHSAIHPLRDSYVEDALYKAMHRGKDIEPINTEASGIAGLGLVLKFLEDGHKFDGEKILVVNTGRMYLGKP